MNAELEQNLRNTEPRYQPSWMLGYIEAIANTSENDHKAILAILDAIAVYDNIRREN